MNPLEKSFYFPPFNRLKPVHAIPALKQVLAANRRRLKQLLKQTEYTWDSLMVPLADMEQQIHQVWSPVSHLNSVSHNAEWEKVYQQGIALLTKYGTELAHHSGLCAALAALVEGPDFKRLSQAQQTACEHDLRDFRLAGVHLSATKKARVQQLERQLSQAQASFSSHVLASTNAWTHHITDKNELAGLSQVALQTAQQTAKQQGKRGYILTLQAPCYLAVMTDAQSRPLRQLMHRAFASRASSDGPGGQKYDNAPVVADILKWRYQLAKALGFACYSEYALATRMAKNSAEVDRFLRGIVRKARPKAERELALLRDFASRHCGIDDLCPWDVAFVAERYRESHFAYTQEELRPYFTEDRVFSGLFKLLQQLYGITVVPKKGVPRCHATVKVFAVCDAQGEECGYLMCDLYARASKRGGAWMDECQQRFRSASGKLNLPMAHIVANFNPPIGRRPAQLTHDDVVTLFHEMGHALHHVMTRVDVAAVSGINGVPWDAVECPSQLLENWAWEPKVLHRISAHVVTGKPLPRVLVKKLLASQQFLSGMHLLRQCELGMFDMAVHQATSPHTKTLADRVLQQVRRKTALLTALPYQRFQNSFSHIFAGGYAAGYYSYLWAEVLALDAFMMFAEHGVISRKVGMMFLDHVLSQGGQEPFMTLYRRFRGRRPSQQALLDYYGLSGRSGSDS
jgi:oligopeptidase A